MFSKESIAKVVAAAKAKETELNAKALEDIQLCISTGTSRSVEL